MDLLLIIFGFALIVIGIVGSILPVLPGPITGWLGLLLLHLTDFVPMNYNLLIITFVLALLIFLLDYIIPALGSKKFGGSKKGAIGATLGLLIGLISPIPLGFIIGSFLGALIGELIHDKKDIKRALKSALGSFMGFLVSVTMKLFVSVILFGLFVYEIYNHWDAISILS